MPKRKRVAYAALGALLASPCVADNYIALSAGADIDGPAKVARIIYRHGLDHQFVLDSGRVIDTAWEGSVGVWEGGDEYPETSYSLGLRYVLSTGLGDSEHTFFEFGIGPIGITERLLDGETNMGYHLQFDSHIGITHHFSHNKFISYRLQHISNGGLSDINPGMNFQSLTIGIEL